MTPSNEQPALEQWFAQLQSGAPAGDAAKAAAYDLLQTGADRLPELWQELDDSAIDVQVENWYQATIDDDIPAVATYPTWDATRLQAPVQWAEQMAAALTQGIQWIYDELGSLWIAFTLLLPDQPEAGWVTKSLSPAQPLFRFELQSEQTAGWAVEVVGWGQDEAHLRLEVAIIDPALATADLAAVPITVIDAARSRTELTDAGGVAVFRGIPLMTGAVISLRVGPAA